MSNSVHLVQGADAQAQTQTATQPPKTQTQTTTQTATPQDKVTISPQAQQALTNNAKPPSSADVNDNGNSR